MTSLPPPDTVRRRKAAGTLLTIAAAAALLLLALLPASASAATSIENNATSCVCVKTLPFHNATHDEGSWTADTAAASPWNGTAEWEALQATHPHVTSIEARYDNQTNLTQTTVVLLEVPIEELWSHANLSAADLSNASETHSFNLTSEFWHAEHGNVTCECIQTLAPTASPTSSPTEWSPTCHFPFVVNPVEEEWQTVPCIEVCPDPPACCLLDLGVSQTRNCSVPEIDPDGRIASNLCCVRMAGDADGTEFITLNATEAVHFYWDLASSGYNEINAVGGANVSFAATPCHGTAEIFVKPAILYNAQPMLQLFETDPATEGLPSEYWPFPNNMTGRVAQGPDSYLVPDGAVYPGSSFGFSAFGWNDLAPNATCRAALDARRLATVEQETIDQANMQVKAEAALGSFTDAAGSVGAEGELKEEGALASGSATADDAAAADDGDSDYGDGDGDGSGEQASVLPPLPAGCQDRVSDIRRVGNVPVRHSGYFITVQAVENNTVIMFNMTIKKALAAVAVDAEGNAVGASGTDGEEDDLSVTAIPVGLAGDEIKVTWRRPDNWKQHTYLYTAYYLRRPKAGGEDAELREPGTCGRLVPQNLCIITTPCGLARNALVIPEAERITDTSAKLNVENDTYYSFNVIRHNPDGSEVIYGGAEIYNFIIPKERQLQTDDEMLYMGIIAGVVLACFVVITVVAKSRAKAKLFETYKKYNKRDYDYMMKR